MDGVPKLPRPDGVALETILGRPVLEVGEASFGEYLAGASVLVTGAGGSLGAELCTRLSRLGARELILVDQAEAPLLDLATALGYDYGFAAAVPVLADVRNAARAADVFARHRPDVVFHAAAYKQVPLLEAHPVEGVATNILGTSSVVAAARRAGVERFVLFSTDKAVHPTSVLGQTKAVAEWIVGAAGYSAVRLGNVVDSAGSILPLFRRQLARGGPLTVTHPRTTRYMLTAGEAAGLAIVAGAFADPGGVLWLDTGPPVRILDVVRRLAAASSPEVAIEFVGLRAGESLHEQPFWDGDVVGSPCSRVLGSTLRRVDASWLDACVSALALQVERASPAGVKNVLAEMHAAIAAPPERSSAVLAG